MKTFAAVAVLVVVSTWAAVPLAQETAPPPTAPAPASPPAAEAEAPPAAGAAQPRPPADDKEFIPTEEISADEGVTFPVDI